MTGSKVYYFGPRGPTSYVGKGQTLFEEAKLNECFNSGDRVAIKIHCGEWNNTGYLRPNIVAGIVEKVKEWGGDPFVTDTTTLLYNPVAGRTTAQDEYKTAARNGFTEEALGCPFIVADGDAGLDDVKVRVDGNLLKHTYIAAAIANADAMITLTHFKGHPQSVYGGAIKNLGIGCCSKRGKIATHLLTHPRLGVNHTESSSKAFEFHPEKCTGKECPSYNRCVENCPTGAFQILENPPYAQKDDEKCVGCAACWSRTGCGVLTRPANIENYFPAAVADSAKGVLKVLGEERVGFISYAIDISPWCDCITHTDTWMLPNLGVFASKDIVAIDKACLDEADKVPAIQGSMAFDEDVRDEPWLAGHEHFTYVSCKHRWPEVPQWAQVNAAANLGLGLLEYELVGVTPRPADEYAMPELREHTAAFRIRNKFEKQSPKPDPDCYQEKIRITIKELTKKPE